MSFSTTAVRSVAVPGLLLLLALAAALSLTIGAKSLPIGTVFTAFSGTCQSADCTIVLDARLPRTLAGLLAGVALGLAGALMQTLTRNPLADPGLLGSTPAPASPSSSARRCLGSLPAGAAAAGILRRALRLAAGSLYRQPGRRSAEPGAPHSRRGRPCGGTRGLSNGIALLNPDVYDQLRFWQAGSLDIRTLQTLKIVLLPVVVAGIAALLLSRALNSLSLGQRYRHRPRQPRRPHPADRPDRHHRPVRQRHRRRRPHRLYRPDDAAYGALAGGGRSSLVAAGHPARHPGPAAVCRRDWPPAGARRTAGIGGVRLSRRAGADLAGAPPAAGRWPVIAPSRRLIASCLLLMAASLLISLLGLAQGPVPLTIDQCSRRCSAMRRATSRWW